MLQDTADDDEWHDAASAVSFVSAQSSPSRSRSDGRAGGRHPQGDALHPMRKLAEEKEESLG